MVNIKDVTVKNMYLNIQITQITDCTRIGNIIHHVNFTWAKPTSHNLKVI